MSKKSTFVVMCMVVVSLATVSQAAVNWVGTGTPTGIGGGTDWFETANWDGLLDPNSPPTLVEDVVIDGGGTLVDVFFRAADPNDDPNVLPALVAECRGFALNGDVSPAELTIHSGTALTAAGGGPQFITAGADTSDIAYIDIYGTLTVGNGPFFARRGPSTITVYDGGILNANGNMETQHGEATINIETGGKFDNPGQLKLARGANSPGQTIVDRFNLNGGQARIHQFQSARNPTCNAEVNINNGVMICTDEFINGAQGDYQSAVLNLSGGSLLINNEMKTTTSAPGSANAQFNWTGGELAVGTWESNSVPLVNGGGTLSPAQVTYDAGTLTYTVDETDAMTLQKGYEETSAAAVVRIDLEGTAGGEYDTIDMSGTAVTLLGSLDVVLGDAYVNTITSLDSFTVLSNASSITGTFNNLSGGRVNIYNTSGGLEGTMLVTIDAASINLSDAALINVAPVITAPAKICAYDAIKDSVSVDTTVTHADLGNVTYAWTQIQGNADITPDLATLTTNDILIALGSITVPDELVDDYIIELTATHTPTDKFSTAQITISVADTPCTAAKACNVELNPGDTNADCVNDLTDLANVALDWLEDVSASGQLEI